MKEKKDKYFISSNKWDHLDFTLYLNIYIYECNDQLNGERTVFPISSNPNGREPQIRMGVLKPQHSKKKAKAFSDTIPGARAAASLVEC